MSDAQAADGSTSEKILFPRLFLAQTNLSRLVRNEYTFCCLLIREHLKLFCLSCSNDWRGRKIAHLSKLLTEN